MLKFSSKFVLLMTTHTDTIFSARQHICYSALYAIARPSVCPSVCPSVTRVDQSKTVEVRITQPLPQSSPHDSSFLTPSGTLKFEREDRERGRRIREGYEKNAISAAAGIVLRFTRGSHFRHKLRLANIPRMLTLSRATVCVS